MKGVHDCPDCGWPTIFGVHVWVLTSCWVGLMVALLIYVAIALTPARASLG